jgi:hypothetical protein
MHRCFLLDLLFFLIWLDSSEVRPTRLAGFPLWCNGKRRTTLTESAGAVEARFVRFCALHTTLLYARPDGLECLAQPAFVASIHRA